MPEVKYFIADDDAFDENGVIKDGRKIRVPMREMRDSRKPLTFRDVVSDGDDVRASHRQQRRLARQSGTDDAAAITAAKVATQLVIDRGGAVNVVDAYASN